MSQSVEDPVSIDEVLICNYCGTIIDELDQQCPALDDGVCRP